MNPIVATRLGRLSKAAGYACVVALLVTTLAYLVRTNFDPLIRLDEDTIAAATGYTRDHPGLRDALLVWEELSRPVTDYLVIALPVCLWVWRRRQLTTRAWWAFLTMMAGWAMALGLKYLVQRARPVVADPVSQAPGYSFPSGHTSNAAIIATTLVLLLWPLLGPRARRLAVALAALWLVVTCVDRVMLGVHYPTDVVGGVLLGCGLVLASYAGYLGWTPPMPTHTQET